MATYMVGVDGSKNAHEAFDTACRLLQKDQDKLIVITCAETVCKDGHNTITPRAERAQKAILEPFRALAEERGITVETVMTRGSHVGRTLCDLAKERDVDFLVVGREGMNSKFKRMPGHTSKYVKENTHCNVVVVVGGGSDANGDDEYKKPRRRPST